MNENELIYVPKDHDPEGNKFHAALDAAQSSLLGLLTSNPEMTALELMAFHTRWYRETGHRNLGRMYVHFTNHLVQVLQAAGVVDEDQTNPPLA